MVSLLIQITEEPNCKKSTESSEGHFTFLLSSKIMCLLSTIAHNVFMIFYWFSWDWFTGGGQNRRGCLEDYRPINHFCFACFPFDVMATKPTQTILPRYVSESANTDRQKSHNTCKHMLCTRLMLQVEACFIASAGLPAGENHWASASNSSPAAASFSTSSSDEVYGRQQTHRTHMKPEP